MCIYIYTQAYDVIIAVPCPDDDAASAYVGRAERNDI